ncbi:MAG: EF-hand domain-containing protein [Asticcacaulis sp.]|nr:EF-hand domain-containing protein [Asticcacaulis sp.]
MSKMRLFSAVVIAAAALTSAVHAQGWGGGMLARYDADKDGKVSLAEYEAGRQMMFGRVDADGNGAISFAEIDAVAQKMGNDQRAAMMQKRLDALKAADANGDQAISADEYKAAVDAEFTALDKNADGFLTEDEMPQMGGGH